MWTLMQRKLQMRVRQMRVESDGNVVCEDLKQLQPAAKLLQILHE
jgi:hypothetical protein